MIKKICICDRCGKQADKPVALYFGLFDPESGDETAWPGHPERVELCSGCGVLARDAALEKGKEPKGRKPEKAEGKAGEAEDRPGKTGNEPEKTGNEPEKTEDKPDKAGDKPDKVKDKPGKRLDKGKIAALHNAGWKNKDIAEEMGIPDSRVSRVLAEFEERKIVARIAASGVRSAADARGVQEMQEGKNADGGN